MTRSRKLFVAFGLALATGLAAPGCVVRGSGYVRASTTPVVYQEPPPPQVETVSVRPGFVWVRGRWDWRGGQWTWIGGHWERQRAGYAWTEGRWERRGNSWHWIEGSWAVSTSGGASVDVSNASGGVVVTDTQPAHTPPPRPVGPAPDVSNASGGVVVSAGASMYPSVAPPPPRVESAGARAGFVWVPGRWDWRAGQWAWVDGHWERERANKVWVPGRWELQGNYYVWVEGRWDARPAPAPSGPVIRDHRR